MNTIYVVAHKKYNEMDSSLYKTIQVGPKKELIRPDVICDNTGDNIANKNPYYCELTALYWMWKNDSTSKYIGLCHYRRFFSKKMFSKKRENFLTNDDIESILKKNDIIIPKRRYMKNTVRNQYWMPNSECAFEKDYLLLEELIKEEYPEFYKEFIRFSEGKSIFYANMFVMRKDLMDEYCSWIFEVLKKMESRIDMTGYSVQQQRVYGYLAERLFNVWVIHKNLKTYEENVCREYMSVWQEFNDQLRSFICKKFFNKE